MVKTINLDYIFTAVEHAGQKSTLVVEPENSPGFLKMLAETSVQSCGSCTGVSSEN